MTTKTRTLTTICVLALMVLSVAMFGGCNEKAPAATDGQTKAAEGAPAPAAPAPAAPEEAGAPAPAGPTATTPPAVPDPAATDPAAATKKLPIVEGPDGSKTVGDVTRFSLDGNTVVRSKPTYVGEEQTWRSYPVLRSATMADQFVEIMAKWQARNIATPDDATEFALTVRSSDGLQMYAYLVDNTIKMAAKDADGKYVSPEVIATIVGCNKPAEVFAAFKAELIAERDDMRARRKANLTRMQETGELPASS